MPAPDLADLNTCCEVSYGYPLVRWVLGDSLHPGGLELTARLAGLMGVDSTSTVLDAGSGLGATAVHLARTVGCQVTAVTLEPEGAAVGREMAARHAVEGRVEFVQADILQFAPEAGEYDFVLMECVLSIFPDKPSALRRLVGALKPGGRLGLTDVTVSGPLPPDLTGLVATAGCVGGALSLAEYGSLVERAGLAVEHTEDCRKEAASFLESIRVKMVAAELASKLGKLPIGDGSIAAGERLLASVEQQLSSGVLGYGLLVASKP